MNTSSSCARCGQEVQPDWTTCPRCGQSLTTTTRPASAAAPASPPGASLLSTYRWAIRGVAAVVLLTIFAVGLGLILTAAPAAQPSSPTAAATAVAASPTPATVAGGAGLATASPVATATLVATALASPVTTPTSAPPSVPAVPATATALPPTAPPAPSPTPPPPPTVTPAAPTPPPAAPSPAPRGTVAPGWQLFTGNARVPFVIAYPPGWRVDEQKDMPQVRFIAPDDATFVIIGASGNRPAGTAEVNTLRGSIIDAFRSNLTAVELTRPYEVNLAGIVWAGHNLLHTVGQQRHAMTVAVGLNGGVPWYFALNTKNELYNAKLEEDFGPMLRSLSIYGNPA